MPSLSKYVSLETGAPPPAVPEVIILPESTTSGELVSTVVREVSKGDPGYDEAVKRWMYLNGYVPAQPTATVTLKGGPESGWYAPPKGSHTGEKHRSVGSGKADKSKPDSSPSALSLTSAADVREYGQEYWASWKGDLSRDEVNAISAYSMYDFAILNSQLRGAEIPKELGMSKADIQEYIDSGEVERVTGLLDSSMAPNPAAIITYRGVSPEAAQRFRDMPNGASFTDQAYVSTSVVDGIDFQSYIPAEEKVAIRVAPGVKAAYLGDYRRSGDGLSDLSEEEHELLIHRGATFTRAGSTPDGLPLFEVME